MASIMPWFRVFPRSRCAKTTVSSTVGECLDAFVEPTLHAGKWRTGSNSLRQGNPLSGSAARFAGRGGSIAADERVGP